MKLNFQRCPRDNCRGDLELVEQRDVGVYASASCIGVIFCNACGYAERKTLGKITANMEVWK